MSASQPILSIPALLNDETLRRQEFPVCKEKIFLAHAGVCPLPRRVVAAMRDYLESATRDDQEDSLPERVVAETRQLAAALLGASRDEIAFVGSTSMGLALVAAGLDWQPGDNVVCYRDDYPANVYPWMNLAGRGVEVRFVEPRIYGNITVEDLERIIDKRTRLVSLASVHFVSGWRLDVDGVGQFLRRRGILFCLDGIQSFGALETSVRYVDFAAADAHKWLLGPLGTAILYVCREHLERLRPTLIGWHNAMCPGFVAQEQLSFWPDARRYEPGSLNLTGIVGLHAALTLIHEIGIAAIEARNLVLIRSAIGLGQDAGLDVVGPTVDSGRSSIVSFMSSTDDLHEHQSRLTTAGTITSLRCRRDGRKCLRLSPHFYNRREEIEAVLSQLQAAKQ